MSALHLLSGLTPDPRAAWLPVVLLIVIGIGFAATNVAASLLIGPKRTGPTKASTYESGMVPIGDTRRRFNVRFYIVAMIFLVFDVDIIFFYPWATIFAGSVMAPVNQAQMHQPDLALMLLVDMFIFVGLLLLAYFYAWGKGVFRWD